MMIVAGCNLYFTNESFAKEKVTVGPAETDASASETWPVLKRYDQDHLGRFDLVEICSPKGVLRTARVWLQSV